MPGKYIYMPHGHFLPSFSMPPNPIIQSERSTLNKSARVTASLASNNHLSIHPSIHPSTHPFILFQSGISFKISTYYHCLHMCYLQYKLLFLITLISRHDYINCRSQLFHFLQSPTTSPTHSQLFWSTFRCWH